MTKSTGKQSINRYMNLEERFWKQTMIKDNDCWKWIGSTKETGYGQINVDGTPRPAHRISWILHFGDIPDELHVLHECDNPSCVNPNHLFLGTNKDNVQDKTKKGRQSKGIHRPAHKLDDFKVMKIREMYNTGKYPQTYLSNMFGVATSQINSVVNFKSWKHVK